MELSSLRHMVLRLQPRDPRSVYPINQDGLDHRKNVIFFSVLNNRIIKMHAFHQEIHPSIRAYINIKTLING